VRVTDVVPTDVAEVELTVGGAVKVYALVEVTVPPEPVSTTSTTPADFVGVCTVTEVALTLTIDEPAVPPNVTADVSVKLVPVIVTVVPPAVDPLTGDTESIVGVPTYVKPLVSVAEPPGVVKTTFTAPAACAGATTVTEVALTLVKVVPAEPSKVTAVVPVRFVPVIVTVVPPAVGPLEGEIPAIVGTAK
jgi:hypothetical protein